MTTLVCPCCKVSSLTCTANGVPRCDGCGRTCPTVDKWYEVQESDSMPSPFYGRKDLFEHAQLAELAKLADIEKAKSILAEVEALNRKL